MMRFAIDGITSFSDIPLRFASYFGFVVSAIAFVYALVVVIAKLFGVYPPGVHAGLGVDDRRGRLSWAACS